MYLQYDDEVMMNGISALCDCELGPMQDEVPMRQVKTILLVHK